MILHNGELWAVDARFESKVKEITESQQLGFLELESESRPSMIVDLPWNGIAVIRIAGALSRSARWWGPSYQTLISDLDFLEGRESCRGVILLVDCVGGMVMGCQEACDRIDQFAKSKPIETFAEGYLCSAAYRLACHTKKISATKSAQIGSIGTMLSLIDTSKYYTELGVERVVIATGAYKALGLDGAVVTQEQRQFLQDHVASLHAGFVESLKVRGLTTEQQSAVSDGRFWEAAEAKSLGLIDEIGSYQSVVSAVLTTPLPAAANQMENGQMSTDTKPAGTAKETAPAKSEVVSSAVAVLSVLSIADIKAACPGASAEFVLAQAELTANTIEKVQAAWIAEQSKQLAAAKQEKAVDDVVKTAPAGNSKVSQSPAAESSGGADNDPVAHFEGLVSQAVAKCGGDRAVALRSAVAAYPAEYTAYMQGLRSMSPEQVAARRARNAARSLAD
jgi:signal peptide peptidase SppA